MNSRKSNIELLRIILMLFVVGGHIVFTQESLLDVGSIDYYIGNVYRSFCICAVNCFIIISGYFRINFKIKKILQLAIRIFMYSSIIYILCILFGVHQIKITKDILFIAPIFTQRYWFITMYLMLCILSPILNKGIDSLCIKQKNKIIILITSAFYIYPSISNCINAPAITNDEGYGIVNFICLYFIGTYINEKGINSLRKKFYLIGYMLSSLFLFGTNHLLSLVFDFPFNSFINYNTIFCLISAICLFCFFSCLNFSSQIINKLSKVTLWVFVIHAHPIIWDTIFVSNIIPTLHGLKYIMIIVLIPIIVYGLVFICNYIYEILFNKCEEHFINKILQFKLVKQIEENIINF